MSTETLDKMLKKYNQEIITNQEFIFIDPSEIIGSRIKLRLTSQEYEAIKLSLKNFKRNRLASRIHAQKTRNKKSKNLKKPIYLMKEQEIMDR